MDYDYPCNFSRPVSEQLHGNSSTNFSGANPRASSFSTYSNSSFGSSSSTYDSSSSSSSSLGQNGGNSSSSGGHLASPQSPAYVSVGFTAANSTRDGSKQSATLFSTLLSKHPNAKSSVQLESVVPLVPPKHRAAPGIYYDMPKNIPVDPRWQVPSAGQHSKTTIETPKFPVAAISTPNLYDRPQLPEKSSAVQTKQSMLSLIGSSSISSPKPHHHNSTLPVIVGASLKAVPGMSHSMQSVAAPPPPPLSVNTSAYMSTVLGFKQSSTAKPLPPLPGSGSAGRPVSASPASLLKSTPPPPPPTPAKPFSSSTVSAAATTNYDILPAKNTAVSTAYKAAAATAAVDDDTTNYDVLPAKNTAVSAYKTAAAAAADQVDFVGSAKPAVSAASAQPYKFTSIYSKNYVKEAEADDDDDDDDDEDCDYDYDYVCLESKKKLDDEDAGIRRIIPRDFQTRYEKLALNSSSGGVDLSHLERQMQAHSLSASSNNNSRLNNNSSSNSAVKRQLLASYRQYLATAMANFAQWISLTLEIIERNAQQPSVYINFAKHILLSGQNLLLVAKSLNRHYSQLRSLATFADSFYEYLRVIVLKTKRAAAGAGGGGNFDRQAVSEMVDSIKGALRFASHLKVELIQ